MNTVTRRAVRSAGVQEKGTKDKTYLYSSLVRVEREKDGAGREANDWNRRERIRCENASYELSFLEEYSEVASK